MRLSPPEPSFLDMRNAILAADQGLNGGANEDLIWTVFADRGMGFFASVDDSSDTAPFENFDTPPADTPPRAPSPAPCATTPVTPWPACRSRSGATPPS